MELSLTPTSFDLEYKTDCLKGILLSDVDRKIFWIGGTVTLLATFFVILGSYKYKAIRKQPGDLIVGIAFSDFMLCVHWLILATWYQQVDDPTFCVINGSIGAMAGINEFLYNVSFSIYLIIVLKNALKQVKIPKKTFHVVNITISLLLLIYLLDQEEIGKTLSGTCSLKAKCSEGVNVNIGPFIAAFYAGLGFYTYYYIKKNAPKCQRVHAKRTQFLMYYLRYIVASTIIYSLIAIMSVAMTILIKPKDLKRKYMWLNSIFNVLKLCSPLVLSFIRYNDPVIRKAMLKTVMFWKTDKKKHDKNPKTEPLIRNDTVGKHFELEVLNNLRGKQPVINENRQSVDSFSSRGSFGNEFAVTALTASRKEEVTYTLLSSVLYASHLGRQHCLKNYYTYERKAADPMKHQVVCFIEEENVVNELPFLKKELERVKYNILPGTLKIYNPEIYAGFLMEETDYLDIKDSLDFSKNREQIKNASGGEGGKSGEFFFFSSDKKLILKTIPDSEMKMLNNIIGDYQQHFREYPCSLIAKIFGAFTYENTDEGLKYNLIVMKNVCGFPSRYIERVYDLKGSKHDREVLTGQEVANKAGLKNHVLKDLDFERFEKQLYLKQQFKQRFLNQIEVDSQFFRRHNLIDYSFIVFIVNKARYGGDVGYFRDFTMNNPLASIESTQERGVFYNMGIIDYLQPYTLKKALERIVKRIKAFDPNLETSTQNPHYYSERFINFIRRIVEP